MVSLDDIFYHIGEYDELIAESEALRCFFTIKYDYEKEKLILEYVEEHMTNESYYNVHMPIETKYARIQVADFDMSIKEYVQLLISYINNKQCYEYEYGERRVNSLSFTPTI